jgi:hypothetical protein
MNNSLNNFCKKLKKKIRKKNCNRKKRSNSQPTKPIEPRVQIPIYSQDTINHIINKKLGAFALYDAAKNNSLHDVKLLLKQPGILKDALTLEQNNLGNNKSEELVKTFLYYAKLLSEHKSKKLLESLGLATHEDLLFYFADLGYVDLAKLLLERKWINIVPMIYKLAYENCGLEVLKVILNAAKLQYNRRLERRAITDKVNNYLLEQNINESQLEAYIDALEEFATNE